MKKQIHKQIGASILEFLVVAPILFMLAWVSLEFGAIFVRTNTLTKSAQDGARFLADNLKVSDSAITINKKRTIARNLVVYASPIAGSTAIIPGLSTTDCESENMDCSNEANKGTGCVDIDESADSKHVIVTVAYCHEPIMGNGVSGALRMVTGDTIDLSMMIPASSVMRYAP